MKTAENNKVKQEGDFRHVKRTRNVYSNYLKKTVTFNDDCDCNAGGFYEKEITQHYFHGNNSKMVKIELKPNSKILILKKK